MKRFQRLLAFVLVLVMVLSVAPAVTLTANAATATVTMGTYEKLSNLSITENGSYIFLFSGNHILTNAENATDASYVATADLSSTPDTITVDSTTTNYVWVVDDYSSGSFTLKGPNGSLYCGASSSLNVSTTNATKWTVSSNYLQSTDTNPYFVKYASTKGFRGYNTTGNKTQLIAIYKLSDGSSGGDTGAGSTWTLVTSTSSLDFTGATKYIFVGVNSSTYYASGTYYSGYLYAKVVPSPVGNVITMTGSEEIDTFTLSGSLTAAVFTSADKGAALSSSSSTTSTVNYTTTNTAWTISSISASTGQAMIQNNTTSRYIGFNYNGGSTPRFAAYKDTTSYPVYLYASNAPSSGGDEGGEGGETVTTRNIGINIIAGQGTAYFLDSSGNKMALGTEAGKNDYGTEYTVPSDNGGTVSTPHYAVLNRDETYRLVMTPAEGQKLSALEQGSTRILEGTSAESGTYYYDASLGAYVFPFNPSDYEGTTGYSFRVTFLPRRGGTGITAVQTTTIADGLYVITGYDTDTNTHDIEHTSLLYGTDDTAVDDTIGRKTSALLLADNGVSLTQTAPYTLSGLNEGALFEIKKVTGTDYYTIRLYDASTDAYLCYPNTGSSNTMYTTSAPKEAYCTISITSDGVATITYIGTGEEDNGYGRILRFNTSAANLQFRFYESTSTTGNLPVLYKANITGYTVTYSGTSGGTVSATNETTGNAVTSGSTQKVGSKISFHVTPAVGYVVDTVTLNGESVVLDDDNNYTYTGLDKNLDFVVSFKKEDASNTVTVNYYVNEVLKDTATVSCGSYYYIDTSKEVTLERGTYKYADLEFNRAENITSSFTTEDLYTFIPVANNDVVNLYFTTIAVKLNKTAEETTAATASAAIYGGDTAVGNFTAAGDTASPDGNIMQTYKVSLNVASSDMIPGYNVPLDTDIILILDTSNSMYDTGTDETDSNAVMTKTAVEGFLNTAMNGKNAVAIVSYGTRGYAWKTTGSAVAFQSSMGLTYGGCFTIDKAEAMSIVSELYTGEYAVNNGTYTGGTNMSAGLYAAKQVAATRSNETTRNLMVVMFTDGVPTFYSKSNGALYDNNAGNSGMYTSDWDQYYAISAGQALKNTVTGFTKAEKNVIVSVGLIPLSDSVNADEQKIARYTLGATAGSGMEGDVRFYNKDDVTDISKYVDLSTYASNWTGATPFSDYYYPIEDSSTDLQTQLNKVFNDIAVEAVSASYITGTVTDTIPAGFALKESSLVIPAGASYSIKENADGTTTIIVTNVAAKNAGSVISYNLTYLGGGAGSAYTNTSATFAYHDYKEDQDVTLHFTRPVVQVIPWTVDDTYDAFPSTTTVVNITDNDLYKQLEDGGYTITNKVVTLTDANGDPAIYYNNSEHQGDTTTWFDAEMINASNGTVSFYSSTSGAHTFYYTVTVTAVSPTGEEITVTSRVTTVVVNVTETTVTTPDVGICNVGNETTLNLTYNDQGIGADYTGGFTLYTEDEKQVSTGNLPDGLSSVSVSNSGLLTYTMSEPGVTVLYYQPNAADINNTENRTAVYLFGLEEQYIVLDFGLTTDSMKTTAFKEKNVTSDLKLSQLLTYAASAANSTDVCGYNFSASAGDAYFSFWPQSTNFAATTVYTYSLSLAESMYSIPSTVSSTVTVMPANNVYYEEDFITFNSGWNTEGSVISKNQEANNTSMDASHVHGYDSHYAGSSDLSNGTTTVATVSSTVRTATAEFTFTGTGFDIISQCGDDSGVLIAKVYDTAGTLVKTYLVDTYLSGGTTYYQLPVIISNLTRGTYRVELTAYYHSIFDHHLASESEAAEATGLDPKTMTYISAADLISGYEPRQTRAPEASSGMYNVYIDAVRIYQPLGKLEDDDAAAYAAYGDDAERNPVFQNINDTVLSSDNWAVDETVEGILFLGGDQGDAGIKDTYTSDGVYLNAGGKLDTKIVDGKTYVLDSNGANVKFNGHEVYIVDSDNFRSFYYVDDNNKEVKLTTAEVRTLGIVCYDSKYEAIGPENEIYLKDGQGVAFEVNGENIQISAKVPTGTAATLYVYYSNSWKEIAEIRSRTEMYYDLSQYIAKDGTLIIKCETSDKNAVLSLCNFKGFNATEGLLTRVSQNTAYYASLAFQSEDPELPDIPVEPDPTESAAISIGQQLSLGSDLRLTFRIKESQLTEYDVSTAYLVVERDIYPTGEEMYVKTDTLTEYTIEDSRLVFVYSGIAAAQMNDEIRVTLHIKDSSGKEYVSDTLVTSVTAYAKLLLDAYGTTNEKLCTVLMDMLNYGTAAQLYFDRHADAPANTAYAEFANYASYASADFVTPLADLSSVLTNEGATATMNLSVDLATQIGIVYKVTLPSGVNAADATVVVKDEDGNELETLSLADGTVDTKGRYVVTYYGTPSRLMRRVVNGTVYVNGAAISNTYGYSISTYAYQIANTAGMPEALVNLTNLMTMYGDAANAYFGG